MINGVTRRLKLIALLLFVFAILAWIFLSVKFGGTGIISKEVISTSTDSYIPVPSKTAETEDKISSSTVQVGKFTVVVTCNNLNPIGIQVISGGSTSQNISVRGSTIGVRDCPQAEEQDVNFDGYPDFVLLMGTGSGGSSVGYWLFSSSTQEFSCPEGNDYLCRIMNPVFKPESKTIVSAFSMGAGVRVIDIYGFKDGKIILLNHERIEN